MLAKLVERGRTPELRALYTLAPAAAITLFVVFRSFQYTASGTVNSDFESFYVVARMLSAGRIVDAYDLELFAAAQLALLGAEHNLAWTYPPPFNLVIAPLAWMPRSVGFPLFMGITLAACLLVVRRLAVDWLAPALMLLVVPAFNIIAMGQNGFLTGALAGLAMLGMVNEKRWAGVPLGLMVIKPHLAIGFAAYVIVRRDWRTFWTAAGTVALALLISTLVLGVEVWPAFVSGVRTTSALLPNGFFPFYRMVSPFATLVTFGVAPLVALAVQAICAVLMLCVIGWAATRLTVRRGLAVTGFATMLISPYVYDYDILIAAAALALLMPQLPILVGPAPRSMLYAGFSFAAGFGLAAKLFGPEKLSLPAQPPLALASLGFILATGIVAHALWRGPADPNTGRTDPAQ